MARSCARCGFRGWLWLAGFGLLPMQAGAYDLHLDVNAANGLSRANAPALDCASGGRGAYRHLSVEAPLAAGALGLPPAIARASFDIHHDQPASKAQPVAFLLGSESHLTLLNPRGAIRIALRSGSCAAPTLLFDGETATLAAPAGAWIAHDLSGSGSYRQVGGAGHYGLRAELNPGADNGWRLQLDGQLSVPAPAPTLKVERVYWGNLGLDYAARVVAVDFRVSNSGAGDSYGARFRASSSPTAGVSVCGEPARPLVRCPNDPPPAVPLGDLPACAAGDANCTASLLTVRYKLGLLGPCALLLLGCEFDARLDFDLPDAFDVVQGRSATIHVKAPNLPPPAPAGDGS